MPLRRVTLEEALRQPLPGVSIPVRLTFAPDGSLYYLYSPDGALALSLMRWDPGSGMATSVLGPGEDGGRSLAEQLKRERLRLMWEGVTDFDIRGTAEAWSLLVPRPDGLWVSRQGAEPVLLEGTAGAAEGRLSPDGRAVSFVREGEIFVTGLEGGSPRQVTTGALPHLTHGLAEYASEEEFDAHEGYWVSPDGTTIAFKEVDERHIPPYYIVHQADPEATVEEHRYPFTGRENARVRLGVVPQAGGDATWIIFPEVWEYIVRVHWAPTGDLWVMTLSRDQMHAAWNIVPAGGSSARVVHRLSSDVWVNVPRTSRPLADGSLLTTDEASGRRQIVRITQAGERIEITRGTGVVTDIVDLDEERGIVRFVATTRGGTGRSVFEVTLGGGEVRRLTPEGGMHGGVFSPDHRSFVHQYDSLTQAPVTTLCREDGSEVAVIHANEGVSPEALGLAVPEILEVPGDDGTPLWAAIYRPEAGEGPLPAIVSVYGGPHAQMVVDSWWLTIDMRAQLLRQDGYVVWKLDNRGSANRGLAFEAPIRHRFGTVEVKDQVAGVRHLVANEGVDPRRVGIYGWSYGGYMTLMCLAKAPEVFTAGVAGAPVTDFRMYDTAYTERYMGMPGENSEGYDGASVLAVAAQIEGDLLVIHGLTDENVHFRHTARFLAVCEEAGIEPEILLLPGRHSSRGNTARHALTRTVSFLKQHV